MPTKPAPHLTPGWKAWLPFCGTLLLALLSIGLGLRGRLDFSRQGFNSLFQAGIGLIALSLFLGLLTSSPPGPGRSETRHKPWQAWLAGFLGVLLLSVSIVLVADPYSRFGMRPFPRLVIPMVQKVEAYSKLQRAPRIVVLGSSRALPIAPAYLEEKLGAPAFNLAVQGASTEGLLIFSRFMLDEGKFPEVLFVEVSPPLDRGEGAVSERTPPSLFPYTAPDLLLLTLRQDFLSLFNIHGVSDAAFLILRWTWLGVPEDEVRFDEVGTISSVSTGIDLERLEESLEEVEVPTCSDLEPQGVANLEELIRMASKQESAVVFFQSPRHPLLYEQMTADPRYTTCLQAFDRTLQALADAYPNVFFLEYIQLQTVIDYDLLGFYDPHHITVLGANALVDAALPTLQQALDWSAAQRALP